MEKVRTYLLLAVLLLMLGPCGSRAVAQTSLYKVYVGRAGINASCIENYPIGKGMKVTVTMLEAQDSTAFRHLMRSLKALPYSGDKTKNRKGLKKFVSNLDSLKYGKPAMQFEESLVRKLISHVKGMNMEIRVADTATRSLENGKMLNLVCADPLPGDEGLYLIYNSNDMMTALIFHCLNNDEYTQTVVYVLKTAMKKWGSSE